VELISDAGEAPALDAEVEELINGFGRVHIFIFRDERKEGGGTTAVLPYKYGMIRRLNELNGLNKLD
jgi:hypothetical protein